MRLFPRFLAAGMFVVFTASIAAAQSGNRAAPKRARLVPALVIDDRLSALRREADIQSEVIQRLRLGRSVYILQIDNNDVIRGSFVRVAATRKTRGWVHRSALAVAGRAGEDERVMKLVAVQPEEIDRLTLCRLIIDRFPRSPLLPRALLTLGEEAERASASLARRARERLSQLDRQARDASARDYYLSDAGLDRYTRLRVRFDFDQTTGQYVYDGEAYREIIRRFPTSQQAAEARSRLDQAEKSPRQKSK